MSQTIAARAQHLIANGHVTVTATLPDGSTLVRVKSGSDANVTYLATIETDGRYVCDCPAHGPCSHGVAAGTVLAERYGDPVFPEPTEEAPAERDPFDGLGTAVGVERHVVEPEPVEVVADPGTGEVVAEVAEPEIVEVSAGETVETCAPTSAAIAPVAIAPVATDPSMLDIAAAPVTWKTIEALSRTEFVPAALRGRPAAALGAILLGRDYDLGPLESLRMIDVIDGSPSPNAELLLRLFRRAGHQVKVVRHDETECVLAGKRLDTGETLEVSYTLKDAQRAGLASKRNWTSDPASMLWARAASRLVRRLAPDALDRREVTP